MSETPQQTGSYVDLARFLGLAPMAYRTKPKTAASPRSWRSIAHSSEDREEHVRPIFNSSIY
jgi:hypothetical protein